MRDLVLASLVICLAGCCCGQMIPQYDSYATYSSDSHNNFYQTIVVEGTTTGSCYYTCGPNNQQCQFSWCYTAMHTPKINNVINGVGGWTTGPGVSPFSYISFQTTTSVQIPPGGQSLVYWEADVSCSGSGQIFASGLTPIQHNYPKNPLPQVCRITSWYDASRTTGAHHANDLVFDSNGHVPLGTPVYAMEAGTVVEAVSGQPSAPYPACKSTVPRPPGNHVWIQTADKYKTLYFHMTPSVTVGAHVNAGDQIGTLDSSGCQSGPHLHVGRKDPNGASVNFTIPCVNPLPTTKFDDGTIDDNVPE
jgi:hypothetical protein